jgi:hypothetical protein
MFPDYPVNMANAIPIFRPFKNRDKFLSIKKCEFFLGI